ARIELAARVGGAIDADGRADDAAGAGRHDAHAEQVARPVEELAEARLTGGAGGGADPRDVHGARIAAGHTERRTEHERSRDPVTAGRLRSHLGPLGAVEPK